MTQNNLLYRPPIVTVMGHIDHGKTSLLDKIRSTDVVKRESGGITQHIGAYQVQGITFIDTPGHAAFCDMRSRGAQITDIVVLVIAATEGIMPQTKECIQHIKNTNIPFIVAMNKMDLEGASPEKIKGQLVEAGFTPEEYGGQVAVIPVSAKTGQGIDKLIDLIKLNAEIMELKSKPQSPLQAFIIESKLDKSRGPVASLIVQKGTISTGDVVYADDVLCKVKALVDDKGQSIKSAGPSTPVEVLGFELVPCVGSLVTKEIHAPVASVCKPKYEYDEENPKLKIILKADVEGTLQALKRSFSNDVYILSEGIGAITDTDVFMADTGKAQIFSFGVNTPKQILKLAQTSQVKIFESKIIYEIIDNIQAQVLKMLEPTIDENILGEGFVKAEFKIDKVRIAGIQCTKGEISKGDLIHLKRDNKIIKDTKVDSIHQSKSIIEKIKSGSDCGMTFKPYVDFKVNDVIISYNTNK
ncbi:MAG: GTP-binding protein [Candidatus Shapirobacteria bacterium]|nr:GTP-binding protein [Candidatus Shapirobacteria bacterium]